MIVDDQPENIQAMTGYLEQWHPEYRLYQATRAIQAYGIVKAMKIDLVISDWDMPGMTGIELTEMLKKDEATRHIPIIIVTGIMITPDDLRKALAAGALDYLRKPVEPVELEARTSSALSIAAMHQDEINAKNLELDEKTIRLIKSNQHLEGMIRKINQIRSLQENTPEVMMLLDEINGEITNKINEDIWKHFHVAFQNVHPSFSQHLITGFPDLTPGELRHCILIKLGMNNKDMASILYHSTDSIKVARSRLRRKLHLENEQNLQSFLVQF